MEHASLERGPRLVEREGLIVVLFIERRVGLALCLYRLGSICELRDKCEWQDYLQRTVCVSHAQDKLRREREQQIKIKTTQGTPCSHSPSSIKRESRL